MGRKRGKKHSASRKGGLTTPYKAATLDGRPRGRGRPRTARRRDFAPALIGRLRRLELLTQALFHHGAGKHLKSPEIVAMLDAIDDARQAGRTDDLVRVPSESTPDGEGETQGRGDGATRLQVEVAKWLKARGETPQEGEA